jgi:bifunctional UDP-N-acetylglucosamine pyrophosphorylase/glucosamine-1-phosphate N-acetyltransferase
MLSPDVFDYIRKVPAGDAQYEQAVQLMIEDNKKVRAVTYEGYFGSYKLPWDLLRLNEYFLSTLGHYVSPTAQVSPHAVVEGENVYIGDGARVLEFAVIRGPAYVGPGVMIGNHSLIRTCTSIGAGSVIGYGSEIKNSVVGENCWTHCCYVGDSVIGDNCSLGAGTVTANLRFGEENIMVDVLGKGKMDSGTDKLGVIMADDCKTGCNATLVPGVKLGPHSLVGPGVLLSQDLEPNKIALQSKQVLEIRDNVISLDRERTQQLREKLMRYSGQG